MRRVRVIWALGLKELRSFFADHVLLVFVVYAFTVSVYLPAQGTGIELRNASIAIVDEDRSTLSARIADAIPPRYFKPPIVIARTDMDTVLDRGLVTFVLLIPPRFQADLQADRPTSLQLNIDATAMSQAEIGAGYLRQVMGDETARFLQRSDRIARPQINAVPRVAFNPNLLASWFVGTNQLVNMLTVLAVVLAGAALIREREHGTLDHLLVMPLGPFEIMAAKIWANTLVIVVAAVLSILLVVGGAIGMPIRGSIVLFAAGTAIYVFALTAIGICLATVCRTMSQLGLAFIPIVVPMMLLSGGYTPIEGMPLAMQWLMTIAPSYHFNRFAQALLARGAGLEVLWRELLVILLIGAVLLAIALLRFRRSLD